MPIDVQRMQLLTTELIAIDSVTGGESEIISFLVQHLQSRGMTTRLLPVQDQRWNVLGVYSAQHPRILFNTHVDTVPPQYGPRVTGDRIYGRGACDTHGILAAMLEAVEALNGDGVEDVGVLLTIDEESGAHRGARAAGEQLAEPEILIVGEPTENALAASQKGLLKADVVAHGVGGHSGYPERSDSALRRLCDVIRALECSDWITDASDAGNTLNVIILEGGDAYNKVPARARAGLFIRLAEPAAIVKQRVQELLIPFGHQVSVDWLGGNDPVNDLCTLDGFESCIAAYNTDISHFGWQHCRKFLCGPGSIFQAHQDLVDGRWDAAEWIDKAQQIEGAGRYIDLVRTVLEQ